MSIINGGTDPSVARFDGVPLFVYGHSYTVTGRPEATEPWPTRCAARTLMPLQNHGVSNCFMRDVIAQIGGSIGGAAWVPLSRGLVVVEAVINDVRFSGATALGLQFFANSLSCVLALLGSSVIVPYSDASIVKTGTWGTYANTLSAAFGGSYNYTTTVGSSVTVTFEGDGATLFLIGTDDFGHGAQVVQVTGAGGSAILNMANVMPDDASSASPLGALHYCMVPYSVRGLGAGSHSITFTKGGSDTGSLALAGYTLPSALGPTVLVCKDPPLPAPSWALYPPYANGSTTALGTYSALIDQICAATGGVEGAVVSAVDLGIGWQPEMTNVVDNIHPNDLGTRNICNNLQAALDLLPIRQGLLYL